MLVPYQLSSFANVNGLFSIESREKSHVINPTNLPEKIRIE